ncbi:baculoviral IAP repeat-containing protein 3-like [Mercenaria mercenaria]|uniref:baculoviral IAP repeat-containing protein 3-like n=1 Tax=Mercenaria mercenaria TaxID=6596 RepID=UPI00234F9E0F|nr:baculoviral IAP repeat-containing protein 3-like [Mercenaria mercenaria]XP_053392325.1 baculoviral IAP repeat-containing protein 3-like [Mercenaria mercenaria]
MDMVLQERRLTSFDGMDLLYKELLDLRVVAEAGFYFTGNGDSVRCYHCGEGFTNWTRRDDAWVEHARHAPHCMHVILTKGEEFVERVIGDIRGEMKRNIPVNNADNRKRQLESMTEDENAGHVNKKLKVFGISEKEGEERYRPEDIDHFPTNVTCARRNQRCKPCRTTIQEQWNI